MTDYRRLGRTEIRVSSIALGTMTWGQQNTEAEGHQQFDYALDRGALWIAHQSLHTVLRILL
jgi:aryl-alcohol dehydrogenase-like predicted oxidoreductase